MKLVHLLCLLHFSARFDRAATMSQLSDLWIRSHDNLSDYEVITSQQSGSVFQCLATASSKLTAAQLVEYNSTTTECRIYKCRPGLSLCRKCRNINSAKQQVWIPSAAASKCWMTVQHRVSNSVNFYRTWAAYKLPFGEDEDRNYWIGLEALNSYTSVPGGRKLRFVMTSWNGSESWAEYSSFSIGPEASSYQLSVSGFSSSSSAIGDSFGPMSGSKFSTHEQDNDGVPSVNVASDYQGAWWFNSVSRCHPNGRYQTLPTAPNGPYGQGLIWLDGYGCCYSLMEIEMLVY